MSVPFIRRLGVQAKVLIPVLAFLVLVPAITTWIVDGRISDQMQSEARAALSTSQTVFGKLLEIRESDLANRYKNEVADPNFRSVAQLRHAPTMNVTLGDLIEKFPEDEMAVLLDERGEVFSSSRKLAGVGAAELADSTKSLFERAIAGERSTGFVTIGDRIYLASTTPISISKSEIPEWVLLVASRLGGKAVQELKTLTNTEIILLSSSDKVAATTTPSLEGQAAVVAESSSELSAGERLEAHPLIVNDEHFLVLKGRIGGGDSTNGLSYLLLYSNEDRYRALVDTRRMLTLFGVVGILLSGLVVAVLVRRSIRPLHELAEAAEAVGRGDFTHRIERISNDECGDLAGAFNRMTGNLRSSRDELEKTVATLRTAQQQLVQSERLSAVGQFVAGVAHELNNPLTAVIGFSDLIAQLSQDEKLKPHLEMIAKSAQRCHKIVHSLLSFSRQHPPERKLVRIHAVIDEVIEIMAYDLRTSNIELVRDFAAELPEIMADPHQLQQVFVNIMSNARQAILTFRQDGRLTVRTSIVEGFIRVSIRDNGPGISPENLNKIFDPFFTTKPVGKGTGLGLSLTYGIISEHGGRISANSVVGHGAEFLIDLRVSTAGSGAVESAQPKSGGSVASGSGMSVLVLDDEEWILELARALLEEDGYDVHTFKSGEKAMEVLADNKFDAIVTDWKMPGMNGIQFFEHILAEQPAMARRVLFMSGDVINDNFEDFLSRHKRTCLAKPFRNQKFREAVAEAARG